MLDFETESIENPFLKEFSTPYHVPPFEAIRLTDYMEAFKAGIKEQTGEVENIINNKEQPCFYNTIEALEMSGAILARTSRTFFNITSANTNETLKTIAKKVAPLLSEHDDNIKLNEKLFERVKFVFDNSANANLSEEQQAVLKKYYNDFARGGVNLPENKKNELRKINKELSVLHLQFSDNVLAGINSFKLYISDKSDLSGLPLSVIASASEAAAKDNNPGKYLFTLQKASMLPFLQYCDKRELRETLLNGYLSLCNNNDKNDNKEIIKKIVSLRTAKAKLLGYKNFSSYIIDDNMAKTPENAYNLTFQVYSAGLEKAKKERAELQEMVYRCGYDFKLQPWDWSFFTEKIRCAKYDLNETVLSEYFMLENVVKGMFYCAEQLYGLIFREIKEIPKPHPDAIAFEVAENNGRVIGLLYMDFYARESKRAGAWMNDYVPASYLGGCRKLPVITMVCNYSAPTINAPSLLTPDEVKTAFHEFGHCLHGLLSECSYPRVTGTDVPRDFVELPSQLMENWAFRKEVLSNYAFSFKTGKLIPMSEVEKINSLSTFNQGFSTAEIQSAALLDFAYHTRESDEVIEDIDLFEKEALSSIGLIDEIPVRYRSTYFLHIFSGEGYASGYYVYNWAEVLEADAFAYMSENGNIFDNKKSAAFRKWILSKGGSGDVMKFYENFRGAKPSINYLLKKKGFPLTNI